MSEIQELFDVSDMDFTTKEGGTNKDVFIPSPENGIGGTYKAIVRFIPWVEDINNSVIEKYVAYMQDPIDGEKRTVESYRSIGQGKKCQLVKTFFNLKDNDDASLEQHKDIFKQSQRCTALIQILHDPNKPESVGQIKIWSFGYKIKQLFDQQEKPDIGKPRKPLDLYNGRPLSIEVYKKGGYPQYDKCKFIDPADIEEEGIPLHVDGDGKPIDITDDKQAKKYFTYLKDNSPSLEKYKFKPWDKETTEYVNKVIKHVYGEDSSGKIQSEMTIEEADSTTSKPKKAKGKKSKSDDAVVDEIEKDLGKSKKSSGGDDFDDFDTDEFDDIDIDDDDFE